MIATSAARSRATLPNQLDHARVIETLRQEFLRVWRGQLTLAAPTRAKGGRLDALVVRLADGAKSTHPHSRPRHARTAAQGDAPANALPRARGRQRAVPQRDTERAHTNFVGDGAPHNGLGMSGGAGITRAAELAGRSPVRSMPVLGGVARWTKMPTLLDSDTLRRSPPCLPIIKDISTMTTQE